MEAFKPSSHKTAMKNKKKDSSLSPSVLPTIATGASNHHLQENNSKLANLMDPPASLKERYASVSQSQEILVGKKTVIAA